MYDANLLREILDAQQEMVCRFRPDGQILFVNRAYAETLGATPDELTGANLWQFVSPDDRAEVEQQLEGITPDNPAVVIENRLETPAGARWTMWRNRGLEWDGQGNLLVAQATGADITERKTLEEQRQLLADELNHRVRNTLMVVQGMAYQSFRSLSEPALALSAFNARLHALAAAHTILSEASWVGADIAEVVVQGLAISRDELHRVERGGPPVSLRPNVAVALILVLHELTTNAIKYGALSTHEGRVSVEWRVAEPSRLLIDWREHDGPPVTPPIRRGFGSRLIETSINRQLEGEVEIVYEPGGLVCHMAFPLGDPPYPGAA